MNKYEREKNLICPAARIKSNVVKRLDDDNHTQNQSGISSYINELNSIRNLEAPISNEDFLIKMRTIKIPNHIKWVSDYLMTEFHYWQYGQYIFINCPTGTGKTTFMEKMINHINGQILILTNRKANKRQIEDRLKKIGYSPERIFVTSYQEIETNDIYTSNYLDCFSCILLDESHYFLQDSNFNPMTNISLKLIMGTERCLKIFMSATNENVCEMIIRRLLYKYQNNHLMVMNKILIYHMEYKPSMIKKIISLNSLDGLCHNIETSESKWLIFITSINKGKELLNSLKSKGIDAVFLDRDSADRGLPEQKLTFNTLINEEKFTQKVLIATSLLDNGVNIKDTSLSNIVIFDYDRVEIIQMIGRKRSLNFDDKFDLYLVDEDNDDINLKLRAKYRLKTKFKRVKNDLEVSHILDKVHYLNNDDGNLYRILSYYNPRTAEYGFNYLGLKQTNIEISMLCQLLTSENSALDEKVNWIVSKNDIKSIEVINTKTIKEKEFLTKLNSYLGNKIPKSDKEKIRDFRISFTNYFWEVYGKCKGDRNDRPFTEKRMHLLISEFDLPIELKSDEDGISLINIRR